MSSTLTTWPTLTKRDVIAFQFSSWYPTFSSLSIKSTVVPLADDFKAYLEADGVFVPAGSENLPPSEEVGHDSDGRGGGGGHELALTRRYTFPELDAQIRASIDEYGADATWLLPLSSPLKCTSPADVYLYSNRLISSCTTSARALSLRGVAKTDDDDGVYTYTLELVLRKWFAIDPSREMRAFVRDGVLIGISQRNMNYYEFLNEPETQEKIVSSFVAYWTAQSNQSGLPLLHPADTLDVLLTRDLSRFHIIDFNPYAPRTDPLLFTYDELATLSASATGSSTQTPTPTLRVIDSRAHPTAARNAPEHQHNMAERGGIAAAWMDQVRRGTAGSDSEDEEG
ncbi:D123-domain-containing protein [Lactifluus volemus]|nr:D123-domain-containing protein [Lactifluus volemus]